MEGLLELSGRALLRSARVIAVVAACLAPATAEAAQAGVRWVRLRSENFELLTPEPGQTAKRLLVRLEQARALFLKVFSLQSRYSRPVLVVIFGSEEQFERVRPGKLAYGYYLPARGRDYIVLQDLEAHSRDAAIHEYTHLAIHHFKGVFPIWLNEGHAEYFSTLAATAEDRVEVGHRIEGRLRTLRMSVWMTVARIVEIRDPLELRSRSQGEVYYAQSWLLAHMLQHSDAYEAKYSEFMTAIHGGMAPADTFQRVFDKRLEQVDEDLRAYFEKGSYQRGEFQVSVPRVAAEGDAETVSPFEGDLLNALLMAHMKPEQAPKLYRELQAGSESDCRWQQDLGYLALTARLGEDAAFHFRKAIDCGRGSKEAAADLAALTSAQAPPALTRRDATQEAGVIEGRLDRVVCVSTRAVLHLSVAEETVKLLVEDRKSLGVALACGVNNRTVRVSYEEKFNVRLGTIGIVRAVTLK